MSGWFTTMYVSNSSSAFLSLSIATLNATGSGFGQIKCDWAKRFRKLAYWYPLQVGYDRPVGEAVYAIDDFPDDDLLWRIEWIGGVGYNTSVPSDPLMDVCMAQLPAGESNPLSARSRSSQTKRTVRIGVGLLPYISIASVWRRRRLC
jgi:hypothetical protein